MKVIVDPKKCVSCGMCEEISEGAVGLFGKTKVSVNPNADMSDLKVQEAVKMAAEACPVQAIVVED